MADDFVAWPFPILKPKVKWTEFDRDFLDFMQTAYAEGYRPRHHNCSCIDGGELTARWVSLVFRGQRNGWEPFLCDVGRSVRLGPSYGFEETRCVCVRPPFRAAAYLALEWLRGRSLESLLSDFEFVGGRPEGIALRLEAPTVVVPNSSDCWGSEWKH
jgi:hypothetical protein